MCGECTCTIASSICLRSCVCHLNHANSSHKVLGHKKNPDQDPSDTAILGKQSLCHIKESGPRGTKEAQRQVLSYLWDKGALSFEPATGRSAFWTQCGLIDPSLWFPLIWIRGCSLLFLLGGLCAFALGRTSQTIHSRQTVQRLTTRNRPSEPGQWDQRSALCSTLAG